MTPSSRPRPAAATAEQLIVRLTIDHPRGPIGFLASDLVWVGFSHLCLGCLQPTSGACGYEFPRAVARRGLCRPCLERLQAGEPWIVENVSLLGRALGDYPWGLIAAGPVGESRYATYRCRWTGRTCRRLGWWRGGDWCERPYQRGYILDAEGRETGEIVPWSEFA